MPNNLKILHIIDSYTQVNYGIWHAVTNTASTLSSEFGYTSYLAYPEQNELKPLEGVVTVSLSSLSITHIEQVIERYSFTPQDTIVVSHGCWQFPTKWANEFKSRGFSWVYVPHGMLEPNSIKQKYFKKLLYFSLIEKRLARNADVVRAVSLPEFHRLTKTFSNVELISNAVDISPKLDISSKTASVQFLFMARIHEQKGIIQLVRAWKSSKLANSIDYNLVIAGPDNGALSQLQDEIIGSQNINYVGAVYGFDKEKLLNSSDFFVLPSRAEGFPGSVIEAMSHRIVPLITESCNFPEALSAGCAFHIERNIPSIATALENCSRYTVTELNLIKDSCSHFISDNYSLHLISTQFHALYSYLIDGK